MKPQNNAGFLVSIMILKTSKFDESSGVWENSMEHDDNIPSETLGELWEHD